MGNAIRASFVGLQPSAGQALFFWRQARHSFSRVSRSTCWSYRRTSQILRPSLSLHLFFGHPIVFFHKPTTPWRHFYPASQPLETIHTTMPSSGKGRGNNSSKIAEKVSKRRSLVRCVYAPVPCAVFLRARQKSNAAHVEFVPGSTWRISFFHRPSIPRQPPPERDGRIRSAAAADGHRPPHPCLRGCREAHLARFGWACRSTRHMFQVGQGWFVLVSFYVISKSANGRLPSRRLWDRRMGSTDHFATHATCHA